MLEDMVAQRERRCYGMTLAELTADLRRAVIREYRMGMRDSQKSVDECVRFLVFSALSDVQEMVALDDLDPDAPRQALNAVKWILKDATARRVAEEAWRAAASGRDA